jgi:glycosyltransferase involved in cell wall biosynthesis
MLHRGKKIAVLSPVAWRTPPRHYGAWETIASNITQGLTAKGWNVTLFATLDSVTNAKLQGVIPTGYEEDKNQIPAVSTCLHIAHLMQQADDFDLIHNNFDYLPLTYSRLIDTPILTTIHGFSSPDILRVYREYKDTYFVSISDSDRDPELPYLATVYNGIDISQIDFNPKPGQDLVFIGRIHPDKGVHLAIETAKLAGRKLIIAGIIQDTEYFDNYLKPAIDGTNVKFIGPVNPTQRNELFKRAYAVLHLNTIPERFGLVLAEANAAGIPVIAMDLGSCREVIADRKTGFLVNNISEAADTIDKIQTINPQDCRKHAEQNFTIEKMVASYEKVYEKIFAGEAKHEKFNRAALQKKSYFD